jgi:hypothetical protein
MPSIEVSFRSGRCGDTTTAIDRGGAMYIGGGVLTLIIIILILIWLL